MCVKGVASVEARLSSFRHADFCVRSHAVLRHAAVGMHLCSFHYCMRVGTFYGFGARDFGSRLVRSLSDSLEGWFYDRTLDLVCVS